MVIIESPRVRTKTPSLIDLTNVEDAQWREIPKWELVVRRITRWFRY